MDLISKIIPKSPMQQQQELEKKKQEMEAKHQKELKDLQMKQEKENSDLQSQMQSVGISMNNQTQPPPQSPPPQPPQISQPQARVVPIQPSDPLYGVIQDVMALKDRIARIEGKLEIVTQETHK